MFAIEPNAVDLLLGLEFGDLNIDLLVVQAERLFGLVALKDVSKASREIALDGSRRRCVIPGR